MIATQGPRDASWELSGGLAADVDGCTDERH